jgi:hypothetical protein
MAWLMNSLAKDSKKQQERKLTRSIGQTNCTLVLEPKVLQKSTFILQEEDSTFKQQRNQ